MEWPERILVVDDDLDKAKKAAEALRNLRWVFGDFAYMGEKKARYAGRELSRFEEEHGSLKKQVPHQLKRLAEENPTRFEESVEEMVVRSKEDVSQTIEGLKKPGSAIALIDFSFREYASDDAIDNLKERYEGSPEESSDAYGGIPEEWNWAPNNSEQWPGCVFASKFKPEVGPPIRVMVPATTTMPFKLRRESNRAITEQAPMRGGRLEIWNAVLTGFRKWIELQRGCPLDSIWRHTKENEWFMQGGRAKVSSGNMPHSRPPETDFLDHKAAVDETLGLDLPEDWWKYGRAVNYIHQSLKHMCGVHYYGSETMYSEYNLTVGSVYIIALLARRDADPDQDFSDLLVDAEKLATSNPKAFFLSAQNAKAAKTTARALYYLLRKMFTEETEYVTDENSPLISSTTFFPDRNKFSVRLRDWEGETVSSKLFEMDRPDIHDLDEEDWRDDLSLCLSKLQKCMNTSSKGFGCPGVIVLEDNTLTIASAK